MENEKRLIDANEPINAFKRYAKSHPNATWNAFGIEEVLNVAKKVDAVEVVRCMDCVWCNQVEDLNYCENPDAPWISDPEFDDVTVADNDFCSYGERRTDNG